MKFTKWLLLSVGIVVLSLPCIGQQKPEQGMPMQMPEFQLTSADGATVDSLKLPIRKKWFLIYVKPNCAACDRLLQLIKPQQHPELPSLITIIIRGATVEQVKEMAGNYPNLASATWYADTDLQAAAALKVPGVPVMFGVRNDTLVWQALGTVSDDMQKMSSILASWGK